MLIVPVCVESPKFDAKLESVAQNSPGLPVGLINVLQKKAIRVFFRFDEKCQKFLNRRILHVFNNCLLKKVMEIRRWTGKHCTFIDCIVALSPIAPYHHSTAKLRRNMSIKISSNIGLCVQKEFFKPRSCSLLSVRLEIIISNHVCFYIKKKKRFSRMHFFLISTGAMGSS